MRSIICAAAGAAFLLGATNACGAEATGPEKPPAAAAAILQGLPNPRVITNPDWESKPSGEDMGRFYPQAAQFLQLSGRATLSCAVASSGVLKTCSVISESPPGLGFGEAGLGMSGLFHMRPMTIDGRPVGGGTVRIPLRFVLPVSPSPPAAPANPFASQQALDLSRRIVLASTLSSDMRVQMESYYRSVLDIETPTATTSEAERAADGALRAAMNTVIDEMVEYQSAALASEIPVEDLIKIAAFIETPSGKAFIGAREILQRAGLAGMPVAMANAQRIAHDHFCRKIACEPEAVVESPEKGPSPKRR